MGQQLFGLQNDPGDSQTTGGDHGAESEHYRGRAVDFGDARNSRDKLNAHANLLQELVFKSGTAAINCAGTGNALSHMVDLESSADFVRLLAGAEEKAT